MILHVYSAIFHILYRYIVVGFLHDFSYDFSLVMFLKINTLRVYKLQ